MRTRPIPKSGELLPVIGLGTWQTFDTRELLPLREVTDAFFDAGCRVIDSSPMYGRSEETTGKLVSHRTPSSPRRCGLRGRPKAKRRCGAR